MIDLDSIKDHVIHIRDTSIWWLDDAFPYQLIEKAGGKIAEPDEEPTLTVHTAHYKNVPSDENFVHEDDFWPECIKQAFPNYLELCKGEYYIHHWESFKRFIYDEEQLIESIKEEIRSGFDCIRVEHYDPWISDETPIAFCFYNDCSGPLDGQFFAFETQEDLDAYEDHACQESHYILIQIQ